MENYRVLDQYPLYKIYPDGTIIKIDSYASNRFQDILRPSKTLKPSFTHDGYPFVTIKTKEGAFKSEKVHRLVAMAFIPNPENKPTVNHLNCIKSDNRVENLEWATNKENIQHAYDNKIMSKKGEKNQNSKLKQADIIKIKQLLSQGKTHPYIANIFGVSRSTIGEIKRGATWTD